MPPTHNLTTHTTNIHTLHPHPANPRNGDTDAIAESLTTNGQYRPIVATTDGTILAGNHTYAAALELGWDTLATVTVDVDPYSPAAIRIMLADNRTADLGRYDDPQLHKLLADLETLEGTGYTTNDLDILQSHLTANMATPLTDEDFTGLGDAATATITIVAPTHVVTEFRSRPGKDDPERLMLLLGLDP